MTIFKNSSTLILQVPWGYDMIQFNSKELKYKNQNQIDKIVTYLHTHESKSTQLDILYSKFAITSIKWLLLMDIGLEYKINWARIQSPNK